MDIILELGGNPARLYEVVAIAQAQENTKIIVSTESSPDYVVQFLKGAGITRDRFVLDFKAWDTVTNFTKTIKLIKSYKPRKLYVVTDKFHMRRSMVIANAVYFLSGIQLIAKPYLGSEPHDPEPDKLVRDDQFRAWLWRLTGYLKYFPEVKKQRWPQIEADYKHSVDCGYPVS